MNVKQLVEGELAGESEVPKENPFHCHFIHHKFHVTGPGIETGLLQWEGGD
jgi:hypothetical protein